ncbi:hypothetical protein AVEN_115069-1 [Araneus ventricosus]|uniref:Uncharacterized protein n=1 Tax=Araneus ventricosus TaxID=182803 RepID=A0A4Y1ZX58_ARAVE|nr:hypothetical protein AVEN_115069-1 [Araneus ventricosus]
MSLQAAQRERKELRNEKGKLIQQANLKEDIEQKCSESDNSKEVAFHQDNSRPYVSLVTWRKLLKLGWDVLPRIPYCPDLVPSDCTAICSAQRKAEVA